MTSLARLQASAGNRAVAAMLQRNILEDRTAPRGPFQFAVDSKRPGFSPKLRAALHAQAGQPLSHTIPFAIIQNDLVLMLNNSLVLGTGPSLTDIRELAKALYAGRIPSKSQQALLELNQAMRVLHKAPASAKAARSAAVKAQVLLVLLNSAKPNLRPGNAAMNSSLRDSIDADFLPGTVWFIGSAEGAPAARSVPYRGPVVTSPPGAQAQPGAQTFKTPGGQAIECVRIVPAHEALVFNFAIASLSGPGFELNGMSGVLNQHAGGNHGQHLSSGTMPTAFRNAPPHPVLVMDPAQKRLPLIFG